MEIRLGQGRGGPVLVLHSGKMKTGDGSIPKGTGVMRECLGNSFQSNLGQVQCGGRRGVRPSTPGLGAWLSLCAAHKQGAAGV